MHRVLIDRYTISRRVREMAGQIAAEVEGAASDRSPPQLTLVAIMTGSLIFLADLIRDLPLMMRLRLVTVTSYRGTAARPGGPRLRDELPEDLQGQHVLLVDDILDSGRTLRMVRDRIAARKPASLRLCTLLRKRTDTPPPVEADHVGFDIPDVFVVGYGLDLDGYYRNLPDLVTLRPDLLEKEAEA